MSDCTSPKTVICRRKEQCGLLRRTLRLPLSRLRCCFRSSNHQESVWKETVEPHKLSGLSAFAIHFALRVVAQTLLGSLFTEHVRPLTSSTLLPGQVPVLNFSKRVDPRMVEPASHLLIESIRERDPYDSWLEFQLIFEAFGNPCSAFLVLDLHYSPNERLVLRACVVFHPCNEFPVRQIQSSDTMFDDPHARHLANGDLLPELHGELFS